MADFTSVEMLTKSSGYTKEDFKMDTGFPQSENWFQFLMARDGSNDLFVIKKACTGTQSTEVHIFSAATSYKIAPLETGTALHETDHSWTFALGKNRDLFAIRKSDNSSDHSQLHVLDHASGYRSFRCRRNILPNEHKLGHDYEFLLDDKDDLWVIKKQQSPSKTEIHVLAAASGYQTVVQHRVTELSTDFTWSFLGVDLNNDVWVVNKKERSSDLYRLTAESSYLVTKAVPLRFPKPEPRLDRRYSFVLATNKTAGPPTFDLVVIKTSRTSSSSVTFQVVTRPFHQGSRLAVSGPMSQTGHPVTGDLHTFSWITCSKAAISGENGDGLEESYFRIVKKNLTNLSYVAEVSFFRESSRFQGPGHTMFTAWPVTDDSCEFLFAENMDMFVIKKSKCGTGKVEVHVLSWASKYKTFTLQVPTILDEVDHTWTFLLAHNLDLICIRKSGTDSENPMTECSRLLHDAGAGGPYTLWSAATEEGDRKTALPETDDSWEFLLAPNTDDLYAVHKYGTDSGLTEITVLSAESNWTKTTGSFKTKLPQTDYNYSFCLTSDLNLVAVQKSRFPFSADVASI